MAELPLIVDLHDWLQKETMNWIKYNPNDPENESDESPPC